MTAYPDFQDYTTSGAFSLALTRSQIATLALCFGGLPSMSAAAGSLARKGLIKRLGEDDNVGELRLTVPGLHVLMLLQMAGLTNAPADLLDAEIETLQTRLGEALNTINDLLAEVRILKADNRSLHCRLQDSELARQRMQAEFDGGRWQRPMVTLRDQQPDKSTADLLHPDDQVSYE